MDYPLSTGQAATFLNTTEPRLAELVRRGRIQPAPTVRAGRRLWDETHLRQAAELLRARAEASEPGPAGAIAVPQPPTGCRP